MQFGRSIRADFSIDKPPPPCLQKASVNPIDGNVKAAMHPEEEFKGHQELLSEQFEDIVSAFKEL